jgi:hypothetical protein
MIGISDQVRAKAERFNRDTTRKYENQTSEQAVLAALKGSIVAAADRCEKALPTQLQQLRSALAGEGDSLGARWATFESQSQAQRVTRLQVQSASPPPHTHAPGVLSRRQRDCNAQGRQWLAVGTRDHGRVVPRYPQALHEVTRPLRARERGAYRRERRRCTSRPHCTTRSWCSRRCVLCVCPARAHELTANSFSPLSCRRRSL